MSTISDVAKRAGVSSMTVSRVINNSGYISQETRERVERAIAELEYVPNALARHLRFKQTNTIALILTDITNPFFTTLARGVEDVARRNGFSVFLCNTDESEAEERTYLDILLQRQADGVLLVPATGSSESVALLLARRVPLVILDRRISHGGVDLVRCDSEHGAYLLTRHLIELGHRRIALVSGPRAVSTAVDRANGYARALGEAGLEIDEQLMCYGEFTPEAGYELTEQILRIVPAPTALFAANNLMAFGAFRAIRTAGLRIPQDISLVTFDDLPEQLNLEPFLTAVYQPAYELGQRAAELLLQRLASEGPPDIQEIVLPIELIVRRSSAPPRDLVR
jgi:LacI family transcriptional regulator